MDRGALSNLLINTPDWLRHKLQLGDGRLPNMTGVIY